MSTRGAVFEAVSQGNIVLNCSGVPYAASYATVAVRFWEDPVPPNYANANANRSQNCGVDSSVGCTGALLQVNLPIDSFGAFSAMFPGGNGLAVFAYSPDTGDVLVKAVSRSNTNLQIAASLGAMNAFPGTMVQLCASCWAAQV